MHPKAPRWTRETWEMRARPAIWTSMVSVPHASRLLTEGAISDPWPDSASTEKRLAVFKEYCCFCADLIRTKKQICKDCGAYVCEQAKMFGSGCISFGTAPRDGEFFCLPCDAKKCRGLPETQRRGLPVSDCVRSRRSMGLRRATVCFHWIWGQKASEIDVAARARQLRAFHQRRELHR
jgi:hypothetical protein